jgi:hypothetical protein
MLNCFSQQYRGSNLVGLESQLLILFSLFLVVQHFSGLDFASLLSNKCHHFDHPFSSTTHVETHLPKSPISFRLVYFFFWSLLSANRVRGFLWLLVSPDPVSPFLPSLTFTFLCCFLRRLAFHRSDHERIARGGHGLPKVSFGPAMPDASTLCRLATPETALRLSQGWPAHRAAGLRPSSNLLDAPRPMPTAATTSKVRCYLHTPSAEEPPPPRSCEPKNRNTKSFIFQTKF